MECTFMCNAFRGHVERLDLLAWISEQRQAEGKFGEFIFCLFLISINSFTEEYKTVGENSRLSQNDVIYYLMWTGQINQSLSPSES
jgi:hypothetical protein